MGVAIAQAAREIGVPTVTLKRWLLSGKVEDVCRNHNGWRVFEPEDIQRIKDYAGGNGIASLDHHPTYRVASFFSGIGGFDLGFQRAGFKIVFQNEINEFCRHILMRHWRTTERTKDIREVVGGDIPFSDVWVAGFPCQDVSVARQSTRHGLRGSQSGLFYELARLVGEVRPRLLIIENVPGLLSSHGGRDFQIVVQTLAQLGYAVGWRVLNSKNFGVPQSRQRVFVVASRREGRGPLQVLFEPECSEGHSPPRRPNGKKPVSPFKKVFGNPGGRGPVVHGLAYCLYAESARHTGTDWSRNYVTYPNGRVRRLTPKECEGVMCFPKGWTLPDYDITDVDATDSQRYHALGNAVTPPVTEWLGRRVKDYLESTDNELAENQRMEEVSVRRGSVHGNAIGRLEKEDFPPPMAPS